MPDRIAFVMEQTLGQVTHTVNFQRWVADDQTVEATWLPINYSEPDRWERTPIVRSNWTLRASLRARARIREQLRIRQFDALFLHTQVTAVFSHDLMRRIPTVVSMDATPLNFDEIGRAYAHTSGGALVERAKHALTCRTFRLAAHLVVWHLWGRRSLRNAYGVPDEKISVIPPGMDLTRWRVLPRAAPEDRPVRLLFVGGDFRRKGGDTLLATFRERLAASCELDIVTRDQVDVGGTPGVRIHHNLGPNAPGLMALYERADIFIFPTLADAMPLAISEAFACGLPVISTAVGAIREQVEEGVTGFLVPPGDASALGDAAVALVRDPALRFRMGIAARRVAEARFSAEANYRALLDVCKRVVAPNQQIARG
jgi:glycosyltransferase involved in cell wall biosynthesis